MYTLHYYLFPKTSNSLQLYAAPLVKYLGTYRHETNSILPGQRKSYRQPTNQHTTNVRTTDTARNLSVTVKYGVVGG